MTESASLLLAVLAVLPGIALVYASWLAMEQAESELTEQVVGGAAALRRPFVQARSRLA